MNINKIELNELSKRIDPIVEMRESWYLVTAENKGSVNTLTCGWGALGSHSGADMPDKIEQAGLHNMKIDEQPTFEEGKLVLNCKIIYKDTLKPENFVEESLANANYPDKDYSVMYIAEIESAYEITK